MGSTNGAVMLGHELRVRLDPRSTKLLNAMAKKYGMAPSVFAELLLQEAVTRAANEGVAIQFLSVLSALWCS